MKTIIIYFLSLFVFSKSENNNYPRQRRGSFQSTFPIGSNQLQIGGVNVETYGKLNVPLQETDLYAPGVGKFLPIPKYSIGIKNFHVDLTNQNTKSPNPQLYEVSQVPFGISNYVDKPVQESQEYVPPQSVGTAIIPMMPPPATPVNALASNIPGNGQAVFLGSGSLGVVDLGGGAYALGSGALGYSERRSNPRPSFKSPVLPPVQASPNLIPAAVSTPTLPPTPTYNIHYPTGNQLPTDQNGYEYLPPNRVGFGDPLPTRPLKTRNAFATPTSLQVQAEYPPFDPFQQIQIHEQYINQEIPKLHSSHYLI